MKINGDHQKLVQKALEAIDKVAGMPRSVVLAHIDQSRGSRPDSSPAEIIEILERRYLATVTSSGAAVGAVAAAPAVGMGPALVLAGGEAAAFVAASGLFALSLAEIHGVSLDDLERRRTLIMAVMLGDAGSATVANVAERTGGYWGRQVVARVPMSSIRQVNRALGRNFVTKYGAKQGVLVLGKVVPFGIGALIGAGGNAAFGVVTIRSARAAFGPPPRDWSESFDRMDEASFDVAA